MQAIEMSQTVDEGMNKTFSSNKEDSLLTMSLIVPIPRALIEEPPTPVTVWSEMGCNVMKSERSGEMCVVQALSSKNGDESKERDIHRAALDRGAAVMAARSKSSRFLLLSHQSTEVWSES